jgi:hypothetical protein
MNTDIRLSVEFTAHHKTLKLRRRLGADGVLALVTLWLWAAKHRPDGTLSGMDPEDIEIAAQWEGQPGRLVADLTDIGFLEDSDGSTRIHNWEWRNPWAAKSEERSAATRLSRLARVRPDIVKKLKAKGVEGVSEAEYQKFAHLRNVVRNVQRTRTKRSTPTPTPDPTPDSIPDTERMGGVTERMVAAEASTSRNGFPEGFASWWQAYPRKVAKDKALESWKKRKPTKEKAAEMLAAIQAQCQAGHFRGHDGKDYIPYPATWLNQGRWQDEVRGTKDVGRRADEPPEYDAAALDELAPLVAELDERDERGRPKTSYREREEKLRHEAERRGIEVRPGLYEAVSAHHAASRHGGRGA